MPIIEVKNLGKQYRIGERQPYLALRDVLVNIAKSPSRWLRGKRSNLVTSKNDFWALKDINFNLEKGDVLGIIGRNGAGKSTLLKILSQITPPTTGEIRLYGRVGSLLEVGTGFHPELTGRENIYLNGAILGMRKKEIDKKFNDIVAFSGVEKFLDTPVKRYSSGMYVRLAFAVAAHLEPDILIVDEVLAVGDIEFQKKCLGKMKEVTNREGRTVIFVSHNMGAVRALCNKCILLEDGQIKAVGETGKIIDQYMAVGSTEAVVEIGERLHIKGNGLARINKIGLESGDSLECKVSFAINEPLKVILHYDVKIPEQSLSFWLMFSDTEGRNIITSFQKDVRVMDPQNQGEHKLEVEFKELGLLPGRYSISAGIFNHLGTGIEFADWVNYGISFEVDNFFADGKVFDQRLGAVDKKAKWNSLF